MQDVECKEHKPVRLRENGAAERHEIGDAALVLHDDFPVKNGRAAGELCGGIGNPSVVLRPVQSPAGEGTGLPTVDGHDGAVAIVLDFMQPAVTLRRLGYERREQWGNEGERRAFVGACLT